MIYKVMSVILFVMMAAYTSWCYYSVIFRQDQLPKIGVACYSYMSCAYTFCLANSILKWRKQ